ncbi:MAG: hypothetical protein U1E42_01670 [Rhodospirillales bacterium]
MASRIVGQVSIVVAALAAVWLGALAGCTYRGPQQDNPLQKRFTWFSYLNGDDIRAACEAGAAPRYRFIYNGVYVQQVRSYDIRPEGDGSALRVRVLGFANLSQVEIRRQWSTLPEDLMAPWAGETDTVSLSGEQLATLDRTLADSGFFDPAPRGLYLRGEDFFWIAVACIDGRVHFNAYKWSTPVFERATFPALLLSWDQTGQPINPPRLLSTFDIYHDAPTDPGIGPTYTLTVGDNGLAGVRPLF